MRFFIIIVLNLFSIFSLSAQSYKDMSINFYEVCDFSTIDIDAKASGLYRSSDNIQIWSLLITSADVTNMAFYPHDLTSPKALTFFQTQSPQTAINPG